MDIPSSVYCKRATIIAVIVATVTLKENLKSRKMSVRPLLFPGRIYKFNSDDNLFSCNYEYPLTDDIGSPALVYFGIKNIGKEPAKNVRVLSFKTEEKTPENFRVGGNVVSIPQDGSLPFVIRIARKNSTEYYFLTYTTTIYYEDVLGSQFYLSIRLWIQETGVVVLEYRDKANPKWREYPTTVWREVESYGYFEMRALEEEMQTRNYSVTHNEKHNQD
jgi:hypothetical protein